MIINKASNYIPVGILDNYISKGRNIHDTLKYDTSMYRSYTLLNTYFKDLIKTYDGSLDLKTDIEYKSNDNKHLNSYKSLLVNVHSNIDVCFILCIHKSKIEDYKNKIYNSDYYVNPKYFKFFINPKYLNNRYSNEIYKFYKDCLRPLLISRGIDIIECRDYSFLFHSLKVKSFDKLNDYKSYLSNIGKNIIKYIYLKSTILKDIDKAVIEYHDYICRLESYDKLKRDLLNLKYKIDKLQELIENEKLEHDDNILKLKSLHYIEPDSDENLLKYFNGYINNDFNSLSEDEIKVYSSNDIFEYYYEGNEIKYSLTKNILDEESKYHKDYERADDLLSYGEPTCDIKYLMLRNLKQN